MEIYLYEEGGHLSIFFVKGGFLKKPQCVLFPPHSMNKESFLDTHHYVIYYETLKVRHLKYEGL